MDIFKECGLTGKEIEDMKAMKDRRAISGELLSAFGDDAGSFAEFRKYVKGKKEFAVCFRGNSDPPSIIIYRNNHVVWELYVAYRNSDKRRAYRVKFNFDHARYSKDWREKRERLEELFGITEPKGFKGDKNKKTASIGYLICKKPDKPQGYSAAFVEETAEIISGLIDDFFDPDLKLDHFKSYVYKKAICKPGKDALIEKRWQQALFHVYKDNENGLYVYDLEFSQHFPYKEIRNNNKMKEVVNEPDMLAVRFAEGKPVSIVMIEVKSTYSACEGEKSGIQKHLKGMYTYTNAEFFRENRRTEACAVLNNYIDIGFMECKHAGRSRYEVDDFKDLEFERMLILTDDIYLSKSGGKKQACKDGSAIDYYKEEKCSVDKSCKENKCSLVIQEGYYGG